MGDGKPPETLASRLKREVRDALRLRSTHPWLFAASLAVAVAVGAWWAYDQVWGIPALKRTIESQKIELETKRQELTLLETRLAPFKTVALQRYGGDNNRALVQLADDVRKFEAQLRAVETKIRTLSAAIEVEIFGQWKEGLTPDSEKSSWIASSSRVMSGRFLLEDGRELSAEFHHVEDLVVRPEEKGVLRMRYRANAAPGSALFGELQDTIVGVKDFSFRTWGIKKGATEDGLLTFRAITVQFFVNGVPSFAAKASIPQPQEWTEEADAMLTVGGVVPVQRFQRAPTAAGP